MIYLYLSNTEKKEIQNNLNELFLFNTYVAGVDLKTYNTFIFVKIQTFLSWYFVAISKKNYLTNSFFSRKHCAFWLFVFNYPIIVPFRPKSNSVIHVAKSHSLVRERLLSRCVDWTFRSVDISLSHGPIFFSTKSCYRHYF